MRRRRALARAGRCEIDRRLPGAVEGARRGLDDAARQHVVLARPDRDRAAAGVDGDLRAGRELAGSRQVDGRPPGSLDRPHRRVAARAEQDRRRAGAGAGECGPSPPRVHRPTVCPPTTAAQTLIHRDLGRRGRAAGKEEQVGGGEVPVVDRERQLRRRDGALEAQAHDGPGADRLGREAGVEEAGLAVGHRQRRLGSGQVDPCCRAHPQ